MEDGDETEDFQEGEEAEGAYEEPPPRRTRESKKKPCNQRLEELSTPAKRIFLALWNEHGHHLPEDKVRHLRQMLQEMYAMTPEETATYFSELRAESKAEAMRRKLKQKLRKYLTEKCHEKQKRRAYRLFRKLLRCGIAYAAENPVPPLVSLRLRYLSDIILEQLCDLRDVEKPCRCDCDKLGAFLISVSDWMAIAVERLYYAAQVAINEMTDRELTCDTTQRTSMKYEDLGPPVGSSSPRNSTSQPTGQYSDIGPPVGSSTPRNLSVESQEQMQNTTRRASSVLDPYYSILEPKSGSTHKKLKLQNKVPRYTYSHLKPPSIAGSVINKTHLEVPLYRAGTSNKEK